MSVLRSPATAYWWRPCVFLPSDLISQVGTAQLLDMLRHELIHVRRRDYLWDRALSLSCRIAFFHPALWLAYRDLRGQRELVCDHEAAGYSVEDRLRYADSLLTFARWRRNQTYPEPALEFAAVASPLAARVHVLLRSPSPNPGRQSVHVGLSVVLGIFVLAVILPVVGVDLHWAAERLASPLPVLVKETVVPVTTAVQAKKTHHIQVASIASDSATSEVAIAELPATLPASSSLPAILESSPGVAPLPTYPVSLTALAGGQPAFPAYAASASIRDRKPQVNWSSFPDAASRRPKELSRMRRTFLGAAVYGLTYLATEATETEKEPAGR